MNSLLEFDLIVMVSDYNSGCWTVYQVKCNHKSKLSIHTAMLLGVMPSIHTTMSQDITKYSQNVTQGDAEAFAITARASAEAEGMNMKAEAFREYKKAAKVITHSNLPYVMQLIVLLWTKIIKLYSRKNEQKELTSHIPGCTLDGCFAFNGRRGFGSTVTVRQGIQMINLKKRSPFSFYPMILNFDILEYLKVYATKACDEYINCSPLSYIKEACPQYF